MTMTKEKVEKLQKLYEIVGEEHAMDALLSLTEVYFCIYYMDIRRNRYVELFTADRGTRGVQGLSGRIDEGFERMLCHLVPESYVEELREFSDLSTLNERLSDKKAITREFQGIHGGWYRAYFIMADREETGEIAHVFWAVRRIDEEKERELKLTRKVQDGYRVVEGMIREYHTIWIVDTRDRSLRLYRSMEGFGVEKMPRRREGALTYEELMDSFIEQFVAQEDRERIHKGTDLKNVLEQTKDHRLFSMNYQHAFTDGGRVFNQVVFASFPEEQTVIMGYRNINESIRKQMADNRRLKAQYDIAEVLGRGFNMVLHIHAEEGLANLIKMTGYEIQGLPRQKDQLFVYEELLDRYVEERVFPEDRERIRSEMKLETVMEKLQSGEEYTSAYRVVGNGEVHYCQYTFSGLKTEDGRCDIIGGFQIIDRMIQEAREKELLRIRSMTDELTGCLNRRSYEEAIGDRKAWENLAYLSLDVNGLKNINDTLGHAAGDELIRGAALCMKECFEAFGEVYRIGGDEFVVLLSVGEEELHGLLEDFTRRIAGWHGELVDSMTVSFGVVTGWEHPEASLVDIARMADKKMYESKAKHYSRMGMDRRGRQEAHVALCGLYAKIVKGNLTQDSYQIINMDEEERTDLPEPDQSLSSWLRQIGKSDRIYPGDQETFLEHTDITGWKEQFAAGKKSLCFLYRRNRSGEYRQTMMEVIPAKDYAPDNQTVYLYVKTIDV